MKIAITFRKIFVALLISHSTYAYSMAVGTEKLHIQVFNPDWIKIINQNFTRYIVLSGTIDSDAPRRLASILADPANHYADVYMNSPGGNLLAGIEIGRQLRIAKARSYIGSGYLEKTDTKNNLFSFKVQSGNCYSACALAFLGGEYRWHSLKSKYGVHRFKTLFTGPHDLAIAQVYSAAIGAYIREMGISGELFDYMSSAGHEEILILTEELQLRLKVTNNGRKEASWSIEAIPEGQYLRGEQDSIYGKGKLLFACDAKQMNLWMTSLYNAGINRAKEISAGGWFHSLMTNGIYFPLNKVHNLSVKGDELIVTFSINKAEASAITSSRSIGHAMQMFRSAPTYVGFSIDIEGEKNQNRFRNFISNCIASFPKL